VNNVWSLFTDMQRPGGPIIQNGSWYSISEEVQAAIGVKVPAWQGGHFGLEDIIREHPAVYAKLLAIYAELCK
jgi:hypothetical protein